MRDFVYPVVVRSILAAFKGLDLEFQVKGAEHVPQEGGVLVAFNHVAYVDFILGGYGAWKETGRLPRFMAKREVFDNPIAGPLMRGMHHISVDRAEGAQSMRDAVDYLQKGEMVGIFPEATISRSFEVKEIKSGAVRIAAEAQVPLIPVAIWGSQLIMTKDHPKDLFGRHKTITLVLGEPMHFDGSDPEAETAALRQRMIELHDEAIDWHPAQAQPPGSWWLPASRGGSAPTPEVAARMDAVEKEERARRKAAKAAAKEAKN
jgi:1-acyl-sn-glycerol-3-phosphate acyltransferase